MILPPNGNDPNEWNNYFAQQQMEQELNNLKAQQNFTNMTSSYGPIHSSPVPMQSSQNVVVKTPSALEMYLVEEHFAWYVVLKVVQIILALLFVTLLFYMFIPDSIVAELKSQDLINSVDSTFLGDLRIIGQRILSTILSPFQYQEELRQQIINQQGAAEQTRQNLQNMQTGGFIH